MPKFTAVFALLVCTALSNAYADTTTLWPDPDWSVAPAPMDSQQCQGFRDFAISSKQLLTDGLVVVKDGQIQYEYYDPKYSADQAHIMWSVSKTITGALLGIAVQDGKLSLDQPLTDFYPAQKSASSGYDQIKISDLFYMDTGFIWNEYYAGNVGKSPVLEMLYGTGHVDMASYVTAQPMIPQGPGYAWNYSTGTPVITMGILHKVYGDAYDTMPWDKLFKPLGMNSAVFQRDDAGNFVGGAYAYLSPRDLARLGYLYLNNGQWRDQKILSDDWMQKTLTVSPGYLSAGTKVTDINDSGVYGGSIWLNRPEKGLGRPYPASPEDMYLAIGHFGQFMIVLPSQHMVIARTGYDNEYNSKIDEFVSRAIGCFADPTYPVGQIIPPPKSAKVSFWQDIETLETGLRDNVLQAAVAESVCGCHYISGVDVKTCLARSNIPTAAQMTSTKEQSSSEEYETTDSISFLGKVLSLHGGNTAKAVYEISQPQFGCSLR